MTVFNKENIVNGLNALTINEHTKSKYVRDINLVFRLTECDSLGNCLKTFKKIKNSTGRIPTNTETRTKIWNQQQKRYGSIYSICY